MPGVPLTYPGAGNTVTFVRGHEDESSAAAGCRLGEPRAPWRHARLLRRLTAASGDSEGAPGQRLRQGRTGRHHLRRHAADPTHDRRHAAGARGDEEHADQTGDPGRGPRRRTAAAPAMVRRAAAVRQAHRHYAIARAGGRARRPARIAGRRADRSADDPRHAAGRLTARSTRLSPKPAPTTGSSSRARTASTPSCGA